MFLKMPQLSLKVRIMLLVGSTLLLTLAVTGVLVSWRVEASARSAVAEKAATVASLTAEAETVVETLRGRRPRGELQAFAERLRAKTSVDYIVVLDMGAIRLSHPNPALLGERFQGGDETRVFQGLTYTTHATGTLGPALRVFTPVRDPQGRQVGAVVVGILTRGIEQHLLSVRRMILAGLLVGFGAGLLGAAGVSGRIKAILLGMEPDEIAGQLKERTAALRSVREETLAAQLEGVRLYADALRAQTHEFMNKLHVILGLLELKEYEHLDGYIHEITGSFQGEIGNVTRAVREPVLAGFLLARFSAAREQAIPMSLTPDSSVPALESPALAHQAITILGNFLENAVEAMGRGAGGAITVTLRLEARELLIQVDDEGPGLSGETLEALCAKGHSSKGGARGYGLFHALQSAQAAGGRLEAAERPGGGASFAARLPLPPSKETQA